MARYTQYNGERDLRRPADYRNAKGSGAAGKAGAGGGDSDLEDEGDSPIEDVHNNGPNNVQVSPMKTVLSLLLFRHFLNLLTSLS